MYDYTPPRTTKCEKAASFSCFIAAFICFIFAALPIPHASVLYALATVFLIVGIQISARYIFQSFAYVVSSDPSNVIFDEESDNIGATASDFYGSYLKIARIQGEKSAVVASFPLSAVVKCVKGGKKALGEQYKEISRSYNYCNNIVAKDAYTLKLSLNGEIFSLTFEPDSVILNLLNDRF